MRNQGNATALFFVLSNGIVPAGVRMGYRSDRLLGSKPLIGLLVGLSIVLTLPQRTAAQGQDQQSSEEQPDQQYSNARIVRLSDVEGAVEFQRPAPVGRLPH